MRITFLTSSLDHGGAQRQLVSLAKGLHNRNHSVLVVVFYSGGTLEKELCDAGVPVHCLNKWGRWDVAGFYLRLLRILKKERPGIIHGYLVAPNLLTILLKPFFPGTKMVWGVRASFMDLSQYHWLDTIAFKLSSWLSRFANLIIVNSRTGMEYHQQRGYPESRMVFIPNGIDTERFHPDSGHRQNIRREWGIRTNEKLIGLVGRLDPMKDHHTFLKAAAILAKERADVRFVCVGDGPESYKSKLQALSRELDLQERLIWAGRRKDMPAVYNSLDIASSSSSGEGFPNVVGEAMACGVPCVVTDVGDSAWIVGEAGRVVAPREPEALARALSEVLDQDDTMQQVARIKARQRVESCFSIGKLLEQTETVLLDL